MNRVTFDPIAIGMAGGFLADRLFGDPARLHPVAGFGRIASALQRPLYKQSRLSGVVYEGVLVAGAIGFARALPRNPAPVSTGVVAALTWAVLGGRTLEREAGAVHRLIADDDLAGARHRIRSLVGRDPSALVADELARACVESLAENTSDAVVAPLVWGAVAGAPGLLGYRAVNTLDAMVGHRTERWAKFGWAAARLDDVANLLPARLATALTALLSGRPREILAAVGRDASRHPSPNAGPIETAFAQTLGVRLGGRNVYAGVGEDRGTLGDGRSVRVEDIPRAIALSRRLSWATMATIVTARAGALALRARRDRTG